MAELIPHPDGSDSWIRAAPADDDTWLPVRQAAARLHVSPARIYELIDREFLVFRRPLPRKVLVSLKSVILLETASSDPEFWKSKTAREQVQKATRQAMDHLIALALS